MSSFRHWQLSSSGVIGMRQHTQSEQFREALPTVSSLRKRDRVDSPQGDVWWDSGARVFLGGGVIKPHICVGLEAEDGRIFFSLAPRIVRGPGPFLVNDRPICNTWFRGNFVDQLVVISRVVTGDGQDLSSDQWTLSLERVTYNESQFCDSVGPSRGCNSHGRLRLDDFSEGCLSNETLLRLLLLSQECVSTPRLWVCLRGSCARRRDWGRSQLIHLWVICSCYGSCVWGENSAICFSQGAVKAGGSPRECAHIAGLSCGRNHGEVLTLGPHISVSSSLTYDRIEGWGSAS